MEKRKKRSKPIIDYSNIKGNPFCSQCGIKKTPENCTYITKPHFAWYSWCKICSEKQFYQAFQARKRDIYWKGLELWGKDLLQEIGELTFWLDRQDLKHME